MRSSKSRSRSKSNRNNRSVGNVVNRVFDSSGPEGKVRGTPQQIIEKYNQLTRDAQLSNDRVAAENFQQHAEHYLRLLAEAQREQQERQQQQQVQQERQQRNQNNGQNPQDGGQHAGNDGQQNFQDDQQVRNDPDRSEQRPDNTDQPEKSAQSARPARSERSPKPAPEPARQDDVIDTPASEDSALVETPENRAPRPRRTRRKADAEVQPRAEGETAEPDAAE